MVSLPKVLLLLVSGTQVYSLVFNVETENAGDEMARANTKSYLLTTTVTATTQLRFTIKVPFNRNSLFTIIAMDLVSASSNLVLKTPLPKFLIQEAVKGRGNNTAEWHINDVTYSKPKSVSSRHSLVIIRVTIQAQDHPLLTDNSVHWLKFAVQYNRRSYYLVQKPVTIRPGLNKFVSLKLRLHNSFHDVYYVRDNLRLFIQITHRHDSSSASGDLELYVHTQPYLKFLTFDEHGWPHHIEKTSSTTGLVTMKISRLELFQNVSVSVSMAIEPFVVNSTSSEPITNSLTVELVYKKISVERCQQHIKNTYEVETLDYLVQPDYEVVEEGIPLISYLKPQIKCSSCGFRNCCVLKNVVINSSSFWMPFQVEDKMQFLEFDFQAVFSLKAISLKGSGSQTKAFVKMFRLMFSNDGIHWSTQIFRGRVQFYTGNIDSDTKVVRRIQPIINARYIRIIPVSWYKHAAVKVEFWSDQMQGFQIIHLETNKCIGNIGTNLHFFPCNTGDLNSQLWLWSDNEQLRHVKTGKCLGGNYTNSTESNNVILQPCNSSLLTQKWFCHEDHKDMVVSRAGSKALHHGVPAGMLFMRRVDHNRKRKIMKIRSNMKSVCSEKGSPPLARKQMLWSEKHKILFVCDLSSRSEETVSHCLFTDDNGKTWTELGMELFNLLGIGEERYLYGLSFLQKGVLRISQKTFFHSEHLQKAQWEIKKNGAGMQFPVNIPHIPFGDNSPHSEQPTSDLTIRTSEGFARWGASSAGIHYYENNKWNLVLSWSKLGTLYARPGSCKQILQFGLSNGDGVYMIYPGHPLHGIKAYCDMTRDGGGWTLLITSKTFGWNKQNLLSNAPENPSVSTDHSILEKADEIKDQTEEDCVEYRIEARTFGNHGGIWRAPKSYSFLATNNNQVNVDLVRKFGNWIYNNDGIEKRMPWICTSCKALLTTSVDADDHYWGTIVSSGLFSTNSKYSPAPWILEQGGNIGTIWYWVREGGCLYD